MGSVKRIVETATTGLVAVVALMVGGSHIRTNMLQGGRAEVFVETWEDENLSGIRFGARDATLVITEFMDFQCPFCAEVVPVIDSMLATYPGDVAVVFQHFPLPMHSAAIESAIAAECAEQQGRFREMYDALFRYQDEIGSKAWADFAFLASIPDTATFNRCVEQPEDAFPRIASGQEIALGTGATGTPTIWLNGHVYDRGRPRSMDGFSAFADSIGVELVSVQGPSDVQ